MGQQNGYRGEFLGRVPMSTDNTSAIQARDNIIPKPFGASVVIPPGLKRPFAGRSGPGFFSPSDLSSAARGAFGTRTMSVAFPGPTQSGLTPGDPNLSVGPNHVIATINGRLAFYTKAGAETFNVAPETFFASLGAYYLIFDPRTFYDRYTGRYWIMYPAVLTSAFTKSFYLVALSDDSDPNGSWTMWKIDSSKNGATNTTNWSDYPGFGHSSDAIICTGNMFNAGYGKIRVMAKAQFLAGAGTIAYTDFWNFADGSGNTALSLQPARTTGLSNAAYVCCTSGGNRLTVFAIQNAATTPTLVTRSVGVSAFTPPPDADQPGLVDSIWTVDDRLFDVHCRDNRITMTHNATAGTKSAIKWYELDATSMPGANPTVIQSGTLSTAAADFSFGNAVQNGSGHIGASYVRSGSAAGEFIKIVRTGRQYTDAANTMGSATTVMAAGVTYNDGGYWRWGDYNGLVVDGGDDSTFWGYQMIPTNASAWNTEIFSFTVGTPATLSGNISLTGLVIPPTGKTATMEFRKPTTTTVLHSYPVTLDASGNYSITPVFIGIYDITIKFSHWLRETTLNKAIVAGANSLNLTMINGDVDGLNQVDVFDLNLIFGAFGSVGPLGDIDENGIVDVFDMNIVFGTFGQVGDA